MSTVVIFSGKYGSTRQYAEWIAKDLSAPVKPFKQAGERDVAGTDTVILGSSVMMEGLTLKAWIQAHWPVLKTKRVILFSVSATHPTDEAGIKAILQRSLTPEMISHIGYFPLHGRVRFADYNFIIRAIMKAIMKSDKAATKENPTGEFDSVKRENVAPIVAAARGG
jgi:menaquinone-dependent protoporphyrinogen oxidase